MITEGSPFEALFSRAPFIASSKDMTGLDTCCPYPIGVRIIGVRIRFSQALPLTDFLKLVGRV